MSPDPGRSLKGKLWKINLSWYLTAV